jgi:hypothetical protein
VRNRPYGFEIYLVNVKTMRMIAQIFVAFSENLNFTRNTRDREAIFTHAMVLLFWSLKTQDIQFTWEQFRGKYFCKNMLPTSSFTSEKQTNFLNFSQLF